jgi:hypoxanthine phosphoribosyltransferase
LSAVTPERAWEVFQQADCLFAEPQVEAALDRMAAAIKKQLTGTNPVVVCLMNGGVVPFGRLLTRLQFPLQVDYVHATRYGARIQGGELEWLAGPFVPARDRTVLLVDDILDEGTTLAAIETRYRADGAKRIFKAVLTRKVRPRKVAIEVDFVGLDIPDRYVFGYGMDYKGYLRNAPGIYAVAAVHEKIE